MPTRRILELMIVVSLAVRPAFGLARLWAVKTLMTAKKGSLVRGVAEGVVVTV